MVQRKVPNKLGIKPHHLKSDTQLVNLRPSSPQTHEKLTKIMKKSRPIKRSNESRSLPPFKKKKPQNDEPRPTPNYMKSTSCFDARKERSQPKTPSPTKHSKTNCGLDSGHKGSRASSLKMVRTLTKTPSFKPFRPSKKVILCEDLDAHRATCSSTLKESKFPNYLKLSPGGTELEGKSDMKICPYTYCSLNGHHHAPVPSLKYFLSAKRRAIKTQKSFTLGSLSPRQTKPVVKTNDIRETPEVDMKRTRVMEEESRDFFVEINGSQDFEFSDIEWEEGYCSEKSKDNGGDVCKKTNRKTGDEKLYGELEELYDEESVSSGAWSEEDDESESDSSNQQMKNNRKIEDQDIKKDDAFDVLATDTEADAYNKLDELQSMDFSTEDEKIKCTINYRPEETSQKSKSIPEKSDDGNEKNRTTIIYNIIQFNISIFVNGQKTEHSETEKGGVEDKLEVREGDESTEEHGLGNEFEDTNNLDAFNAQEIVSNEQLNANYFNKKQEDYVEDSNDCELCSQSDSMDFEHDDIHEMDEEPASKSDESQTHDTDEITSKTDSFGEKSDSGEEQPDPSTNLRGSTRGKQPQKKMDDSRDFNPRGPNFLQEVPDPDAETVDLKHQNMDERKNAEEWMVDFALQQAVTTLAPARKKKVALLVEAFEKVMPIPKYETHNTHTTKAFTNARPMQACS